MTKRRHMATLLRLCLGGPHHGLYAYLIPEGYTERGVVLIKEGQTMETADSFGFLIYNDVEDPRDAMRLLNAISTEHGGLVGYFEIAPPLRQ